MTNQLHHKLSVLIKTFDRKSSLIKLLQSLEKFHPGLPILIADDSRESYRGEIISRFPKLLIQYYTLPFDTGLAAGRNFLLHKTTTPYFLLCDDDFVVDHRLNLEKTLAAIETAQLDIGGGTLLNYTTAKTIRRFARVMLTPSMASRFILNKPTEVYYTGNYQVDNNHCTLSISWRKPSTSIYHCDIVCNFFIGRSAAILNMQGWNDQFKVGEHEDFFYRAKQYQLKVAWLDDFAIAHYPVAPASYLPFRQRVLTFKQQFVEQSGLDSFREIDGNTGETAFFFHPAKIAQ